MEWILTSWSQVGWSLLSLAVTYVAIILYVRLTGLRSFSKMSAADFAMTVAVGSLFAAVATSPDPPLLLGLVALFGLFAGQWFFAWARKRLPWLGDVLDNAPLLLMEGGVMIEANLRAANVTRADVIAKLRESNALSFEQVRAVVFESTGDISVLHADDDTPLSEEILEGVQRDA